MKKRLLCIIIPPLALLHLGLHLLIAFLILSFCLRIITLPVSIPTDKIQEDKRISSILSNEVYYFPDESSFRDTTWQINFCRYYDDLWYFPSLYIHLAADHAEPEVYTRMSCDASTVLKESTEKNGKTFLYSSETKESMYLLFEDGVYDGCLCFFAFAVFDDSSRSVEIWICSREDPKKRSEEEFTGFVKQNFAPEDCPVQK